MSTAILPDDSVIVRMPTHTVHVDASARAIHVREPSHSSELGGVIRATFPLEAADRIRLMRARTGKQHLCLDLASGETLDLGEVPSTEVAMVTARAIAELTRCKIEVAGTTAALPGPSPKFTEGETYAHGFVPWRGEPLPVPPRPAPAAPSRRSQSRDPAVKGSDSLSISPAHADRMFQVCEALMESQDGAVRSDDPVLVPGEPAGPGPAKPAPPASLASGSLHASLAGLRTVELTHDEAERAMARARARSLDEPVVPMDLVRDESDDPTLTPASGTRAVDGISSTDRDRSIEDIGVDGLAKTVADQPMPELFEMIERADANAAHAALAADLVAPEEISAATQPDGLDPRPSASTKGRAGMTRELGELSTQPDTPVDQFMEATELDEAALEREPVFLGLLRESQMAVALTPDPMEGLETLVGDEPPGATDLAMAAHPSQTPHEAVVEILRATAEVLPDAAAEVSGARPKPGVPISKPDFSED
jgi:hypothetical protein